MIEDLNTTNDKRLKLWISYWNLHSQLALKNPNASRAELNLKLIEAREKLLKQFGA